VEEGGRWGMRGTAKGTPSFCNLSALGPVLRRRRWPPVAAQALSFFASRKQTPTEPFEGGQGILRSSTELTGVSHGMSMGCRRRSVRHL
jgi:hypothetical protein